MAEGRSISAIGSPGMNPAARSGAGLPGHLLALSPSQGRGGGIEAYVAAVLEAARSLDIEVTELAYTSELRQGGTVDQARYAAAVTREARRLRSKRPEILVFHPGLLPVGFLAQSAIDAHRPLKLFMYGADIWEGQRVTRRMWRSKRVDLITISSFSSGALFEYGAAEILPPSVPRPTYDALLGIDRSQRSAGPFRILSVFRLEDYSYKGGADLVAAVGSLRDQGLDVQLTIAGRDPGGKELEHEASLRGQWLRLVRSPSIDQLVECYAESDVFVLATRNQVRPTPQVEGFGIVLAEAALAGVPAISSAIGGSRDAILDGVTGFLPPNFSTATLTSALAWCVGHPTELQSAGVNARAWAAGKYHYDIYRDMVATLLGAPNETDLFWLGLRVGTGNGVRLRG